MKNLKAIAFTSLAFLPASVLAACGASGTTGTASSAANGSTSAAAAQANGTTPPAGQQGTAPPGMGTAVTGAAATKAGEAATAKYAGTVEQVMKLDDGSYVVHVTTDSGEQHVLVSAGYEVTGLQQMPAGGPPNGGQAPGGAAPTTPPSGSSTTASGSSTTAS